MSIIFLLLLWSMQCSKIHGLDSNFSSCDFVQCVDGCSSGDGLLNYLGFIYCVMPTKLIPLAMILLVSGSIQKPLSSWLVGWLVGGGRGSGSVPIQISEVLNGSMERCWLSSFKNINFVSTVAKGSNFTSNQGQLQPRLSCCGLILLLLLLLCFPVVVIVVLPIIVLPLLLFQFLWLIFLFIFLGATAEE